jgi:NitT/TauT family transport system ATP-binding protein
VAAVIDRLDVDIPEKQFVRADGSRLTVLRDVAFHLEGGDFAVLFGPSGCGKTTLLNIVAGLDTDFTGSVRLGGKRPGDLRVGYVFQEPRLLPWRSVFDNVALVQPAGPDSVAVSPLLDRVGLAGFHDAFPAQLSVGMARRAAIARAFAVEPELLLMDEPFVSLDEATAVRMRAQLIELWQSRPTRVLFVTHNLREAVELGDRILLLSAAPGRLLAEIAVPLPREHRSDGAAVERVSQEIAAAYLPPAMVNARAEGDDP